MSRYKVMFESSKKQDKMAFVPFVMLGDPDLETSYSIIETLIDSGADGLELGIPFSDPVADGPVIQKASIRALENKINTEQCLQLIGRVREAYPDIPVGLLLYSNLIYRMGIEAFYKQAKQVGVDSVLIADVPIRETQFFDKFANQYGIEEVHILPPNPSEKTLDNVAAQSKGYTYILGRAGVTGANVAAQMPSNDVINKLRVAKAPPLVMGFGISKPEQVAQAKQHGFDGVISGSAVVKIIESNLDDSKEMLQQLGRFIKSMKAAT